MKPFLELQPTANQTFRLIGNGARGNLAARLENSYKREQEGDYEAACIMRYEAFEDILATFPDDEESIVELDRNHPNSLAAMEIMHSSAVDFYLAGEGEMAAAQLELLLDCDSEDPLEATPTLALCYAMCGEWEDLEAIDTDLGEKTALRPLLRALHQYVKGGKIEATTVAELARFKEFAAELKKEEHNADERYSQDIHSDRPSRNALALQLYLQAERALATYPEFLKALRELL
ncbi:MAG: tetratricopeptide repeat protein [Alistipes sp.]|nr:tetratricopeptide repeat protein [Alistipes sp.]